MAREIQSTRMTGQTFNSQSWTSSSRAPSAVRQSKHSTIPSTLPLSGATIPYVPALFQFQQGLPTPSLSADGTEASEESFHKLSPLHQLTCLELGPWMVFSLPSYHYGWRVHFPKTKPSTPCTRTHLLSSTRWEAYSARSPTPLNFHLTIHWHIHEQINKHTVFSILNSFLDFCFPL